MVGLGWFPIKETAAENCPKPTKHSSGIFNQLCKLIPVEMGCFLAIEHGVDKKSRSFSEWSDMIALLYAQLTHAISLNDVCDSLRHHAARLFAIREATPPSRNGLSHANKSRNADMMEALYWKMLNLFAKPVLRLRSCGSLQRLAASI